MKNNALYTLIFLLLAASSHAADVKDLDGDGIPDKLTIKMVGEAATVAIESSRAKTTKKFTVAILGACPSLAIYPVREGGAIFVDQSCGGRQAQVFRELYSWSESANSWVLQETVQGESIDPGNGILPSLGVQKAECCLVLEKNSEEVAMKTTEHLAIEINQELDLIAKLFKDNNLRTKALEKWTFEMSIQLSSAISDSNIGTANDLAYYLWKKSRFIESAIILEKIIVANPDRVVAILNFADSLWDLESDAFREKAQTYYKDYDEKMRAADKRKLIPARVAERIKG